MFVSIHLFVFSSTISEESAHQPEWWADAFAFVRRCDVKRGLALFDIAIQRDARREEERKASPQKREKTRATSGGQLCSAGVFYVDVNRTVL